MVRSNPDSLLLFLSKAITSKKGIIRLSFKRGGLFRKQHTKAHKRAARQQLKQELKTEVEARPNEVYPLITRVKTDKDNRLTCETKAGKSHDVVNSLLNFFRLAAYKEDMKIEKQVVTKSHPNALSHTTLKKKNKAQRNKARRLELKKRQKQTKQDQRKKATNQSAAKQTVMVAE